MTKLPNAWMTSPASPCEQDEPGGRDVEREAEEVVMSRSDGKIENSQRPLDVHRQQQDEHGEADVEGEQEVEQ